MGKSAIIVTLQEQGGFTTTGEVKSRGEGAGYKKKGTASRLSPSILYFLILRAIDKHGRRLSICANVFIFFEVEKLI